MRARFQPPIGDLTDPAFVERYITAAVSDCDDRPLRGGELGYWAGKMPELVARGVEINHPNYAWDRLIGWQAGSQDAPRYGPFAQPPNAGPVGGWTTPLLDVALLAPVVDPGGDPPFAPAPSPPMDPDLAGQLLATLKGINLQLVVVGDALHLLMAKLEKLSSSGVRVHF
jgi:hypothetical protein